MQREPIDRSAIEAIKAALTSPRDICVRLGLARGMTVSGPRSVHILCPWHSEDTPSCHVWVKSGLLAVKCHGACKTSGDVLSLIAAAERLTLPRDFAAVVERAAELARVALPAAGASGEEPGYPPLDEVEALWAGSVPVDRCPDAAAWLETRGLDPTRVAELDLARSLPVGARLPVWARYSGRPWVASGHRLVVPMFDATGAMRSVRARSVKADERAKAVPPSGFQAKGLVMASPAAVAMLRGEGAPLELLVVAEGEPDYLTWAERGLAVVGVGSGSWEGAHAGRVPDGATVVLWTDSDRAGEKYADLVNETLAGRARVLRRPVEDKRDVNDLHQAGALPDDPIAGAAEMAPPDPDPRPIIRTGPELHITVDRAIQALRDDADLYQRDGGLVHVTIATDGAPTIRGMQLATIRERLTAAARFERKSPRGDEEWSRCVPPDNVSHAVLARGAWTDIRNLVGVLEAPSLRPDGSVLEEPGYDAATRYLYAPRGRFPRVPERLESPASAAKAALHELEGIFVDFPYRSPADRSAVIAAALTLLARPAIDGAVPAFLFDATTPGSGKTLQADVVAILATGRTTAKMAYPADDDEETEKILGGYALEGAQIVAFDNIASAFGGGPIDKVLTADDTVKLRILGQSSVPTVRWRAVILGTGNNIAWRGDTHRRVLIPKLEPMLENPEERVGFVHPDLRAWVRQERPRLVCAALTLLRAFVVAGRPAGGCKTWGSFEAWSELIPRALVFAGAEDPMACRPAVDPDARDEERINIAMIFDAVAQCAPPEGITARGLVDVLYPADRSGPPDGFDDAREAVEAMTFTPSGKRPNARKLGEALRRWRRRPVGGRRLDVATKDRKGLARWRVA